METSQNQPQTDCINPATGSLLGHSHLHSEEDLKKIFDHAQKAQKSWAMLPVGIRIQYFRAIRNYLVENTDHLAEIITNDNGKTRMDALATEILPAAMGISYYCSHAKKFLKEQKLRTGNIALINKRSKVIRVPYGVVGIITPWNYPFSIAFSEIIMALLAGNSVLFKAATETQKVGLALKHAINAAKLPKGLFNYINMPGKQAGDAFLDTGIDKLFFTGSIPVGKYLMGKAAQTLTPVSLELGGNDAMIVCDDADIERAAAGAVWAGFQNAGQSCGGVERIYVHENIYDSFLNILKQKTEKLRVGYDNNFEIDMGAMTVKRQIDVVNRHVQEAVSGGATIFAISGLPHDKHLKNFIPAMVLTGVNHEMLIMKEETFGPVVGVMKVKDEDEAVDLANDSNLGLTGSVWSGNRKKADRIARKIEAGVIMINDHLMSHGMAETAWGGFKESGIGRTHGKQGFDEMTQTQTIIHDILPFVKKDLWWHPFNKNTYAGIRGVMEMMYGLSIGQRIKGISNLMKIVFRIFIK